MKKSILLLFNIVIVFVVLTTSLYAWYTNYYGVKNNDSIDLGSHANYYAAGSGDKDDPYLITHARHLYNLAWLQDLGYYDDKPYYFELRANIDMSDLTKNNIQSPIPSIGIDKHPFIGNFNGNGFIISNLIIDTDFSNLNYIKPSDGVLSLHTTDTINNDIIITNYVGLFGYIGSMDEVSSEITENVENFYIDNSVIKSNINCLAGIVAGYVNSNVLNVGVHYSCIRLSSNVTNIASKKNISNYTLIGDYNDSILKWENDPSGSGDSLAYGGNFDVQKLMDRLNLIYKNKQSSTPSNYLPNIDSSNNNPTIASLNILPLTVANSINEDAYTGAKAKETVSSQNIGYFCGNQNKLYTQTLNFTNYSYTTEGSKITYSWASKKVPKTFFKRTGDNATTTSENIIAMTDEEVAALPQGIKNLIPEEDTATYNFIRLQQKYEGTSGTSNGNFSQKDNIEYYGKTYTNVYLPNNGIWFKPKNAGKFKFVVYSGSNGQNFTLYSLNRKTTKEPNETEEEFLQRHFSTNNLPGSELTSLHSYTLPYYALFYFEYEVTEEDINNNMEFLISNDRGSGAYFLYLDIGINGGEGEAPKDKYGSLNNIDFVYATTNGLSDVTNTSLYSEVYFEISGTATDITEFYFRRNKDDLTANIDIVLYYPDINNNGLILKLSSSGNKAKAKDKNCEEI